MISLILILIMVFPFFVSFLWEKNRLTSSLIILFLTLFVSLSFVNFIHMNLMSIAIVTILVIVILVILLIFNAIKKQRFTKKNLVKTLKTTWPLYISIGIIIFIRMWFTRMNTDALYYANISNNIKSGTFESISISNVYAIPSFYSIAALFPRVINVYTIVGDTIIQVVICIIIFDFLNSVKKEKNVIYWIFLIVITIIAALSIPFVTAALNWVVVCVGLLLFFNKRKEPVFLVLIPISLTLFSFSAMLILPIIFLILIFSKKIKLKEFICICISALASALLFSIAFLGLALKLMILFSIIMTSILPIMILVKTNIYIINPFYNEKITLEKFRTKKILIVAIIISIILSINNAVLLFIFLGKNENIVGWIFATPLSLTITILFFMKKIDVFWFKFLLSFIITDLIYLISIQIIPVVPDYSAIRLTDPTINIVPLFVLFLKYETLDIKVKDLSVILLPFVMFSSIAGVTIKSTPNYFYSNPSVNILNNYFWIKNNEWNEIKKIKNKLIYSDLPIWIMNEKNVKSIFNNKDHRELFHGDLFVTMKGRKKYIENHEKQIKNPKNSDFMYKFTIEYAKYFNDWKEIDKAEIFIFRHEEYAKEIAKHYNKHIGKIGNLYIVKCN